MTDARDGAGRASSPFDQWLVDDPEIAALLGAEIDRQSTTLQLIASENFTSPAVLAASGSVLTNKYSEGYPGRRYYGGNQVIDEVENLARDRAKALFGAEHANVQPHAGAIANLAVYQALLEPGDTVLAMSLDHGGHLTHGSPASITSKIWHFVAYGVTPASGDPAAPGETIDFDEVADVAKRERPKLIVAGATAYPRLIDAQPFREIADAVGAKLMFDIAHPAGLVAGGAHPNPVGIADVVTLTTHKTLRGPRGGAILCDQAFAKVIDSAVFPGTPGRPPRARHRGQGGGLPRGVAAVVPRLRGQCRRERTCPRRRTRRRGLPAGVGGNRQSPAPRRPAPLRRGADGQRSARGSRPGRDHPQPQHHSRRPSLAVRDLWASGSAPPPRPRRGWEPKRWSGRGPDGPCPAASGMTRLPCVTCGATSSTCVAGSRPIRAGERRRRAEPSRRPLRPCPLSGRT